MRESPTTSTTGKKDDSYSYDGDNYSSTTNDDDDNNAVHSPYPDSKNSGGIGIVESSKCSSSTGIQHHHHHQQQQEQEQIHQSQSQPLPSSPSPLDPLSLVRTSIAEGIGGATAGAIADTVLYAVDSAKVQRQSSSNLLQNQRRQYNKMLFRGLGPTVLLGSVPVFGIFFLLYSPIREMIHYHSKVAAGNEYGSRSLNYYCDETVLLPLAAAVCAVPSTVVGVPSDVLKKHLVLGKDPSFTVAVRNIVTAQGWYRGLFAGWHVNLIRDIPFACVKVGLYELFVSCYKQYQGLQQSDKLSTFGTALCGVTSGVGCAVLTAPLDVVNTRIKAGDTILYPPHPPPPPHPRSTAAAGTACAANKSAEKLFRTSSIHRQTQQSTSILYVGRSIVAKEGISALFRGVLMRSFVLGVGSSIFWPIQSKVSHYFQPDYRSDDDFNDRLKEF